MVKAKSIVLVFSLVSLFFVGCTSIPASASVHPETGATPDTTGFRQHASPSQAGAPPVPAPQAGDAIGETSPFADDIVAPGRSGRLSWLSLPAPADRPDTGLTRRHPNQLLERNPGLRLSQEPSLPSDFAVVPVPDPAPLSVVVVEPPVAPAVVSEPPPPPSSTRAQPASPATAPTAPVLPPPAAPIVTHQPTQPNPGAAVARPAQPASSAGLFVDLIPSRRVSATGGVETVIRLDGENWIFLGATPDDGGVVYRRRRSLEGATEIVLRADSPGDYRILFQRQDLSLDKVDREVIDLEVIAAATRTADVPSGDSRAISPSEREPEAEEPAQQADFFSGDSSQIAEAANRALGAGNRELAVSLWRRNQEIEGTYGVEARRGLFDVAYAFGRLSEATTLARNMMERGETPPVAAVTRLAANAARAGKTTDAAQMLEQLLTLVGSGPGSDVVLYELARRYENDPNSRNLRLALAYYRRITDDYPLSRYWETSRGRIEYIERHFFHLR